MPASRLFVSIFILTATLSSVAHTAPVLIRSFSDPTVTAKDGFGGHVSIDGERLSVTSPGHVTGFENFGEAHLFSATSGELLHSFTDPFLSFDDRFGSAVVLHQNRLLIADRNNSSGQGAAYLYGAVTGNEIRSFFGTGENDDFFASAIEMDSDYVLISEPRSNRGSSDRTGQVHLYTASNGRFLRSFEDPTDNLDVPDSFGTAIALNEGRVLIGGSHKDATGFGSYGYVELYDARTGTVLQAFDTPDAPSRDGFGFGGGVALEGDYVVISNWRRQFNGKRAGQVYVYSATSGNLLYTLDDPNFSVSNSYSNDFAISLAADGNFLAIGSANRLTTGQVHLYDITDGSLLYEIDDPFPADGNRFGVSLAIDGSSLLIGAPGDGTFGVDVGQAYLFQIAVPEPASLLLALCALLAYARRHARLR